MPVGNRVAQLQPLVDPRVDICGLHGDPDDAASRL